MSMESHVEGLLMFSLTTHIDATWLPERDLVLVYASQAASPTPVSLTLCLLLGVTTLNRPLALQCKVYASQQYPAKAFFSLGKPTHNNGLAFSIKTNKNT